MMLARSKSFILLSSRTGRKHAEIAQNSELCSSRRIRYEAYIPVVDSFVHLARL
jgi:hypothetical protein